MTEEEILVERAEMYARTAAPALRSEARYLKVQQVGLDWLFPKNQVHQLVKLDKFTRLPGGVRWKSWPCLGMVCHGPSVLPVLCWQMLVGGHELRRSSSQGLLLLLRHASVAIRVSEELVAVSVDTETLLKDSHPWSSGRTPEGALVAALERFAREEGAG